MGPPPGEGCKWGVRGVNPQRVRIIASFFQFCEILLCWLHCISALSPGKVRRTRSLQKQSLFFMEKRCSPARLFFNPSIETLLFLSFFWNRPNSVRSHQNLHFYKGNRHFFKSEKYLQAWISSKSAGDGGVTTVVLRRPPPGPRRDGGLTPPRTPP